MYLHFTVEIEPLAKISRKVGKHLQLERRRSSVTLSADVARVRQRRGSCSDCGLLSFLALPESEEAVYGRARDAGGGGGGRAPAQSRG